MIPISFPWEKRKEQKNAGISISFPPVAILSLPAIIMAGCRSFYRQR